MLDSTINVLWTCGMGEQCTNTKRPGTHAEYADVKECVTGERPITNPAEPYQFPEF